MEKSGRTLLSNTIYTTDKEAQYDENAKQLLCNKNILAYVLVNAVDEFYGMNPAEVVAYIEEEPYAGVIPVDPGFTNVRNKKNGEKINGWNTENVELNEGRICYDVLFTVRTHDGKSKIIVNIEIQKDEPTEYHILNRAVFYASREISSQKEREFTASKYNDIKQVYSIWICLNQKKNSMQHIRLNKEELFNVYNWKGRLDLINIVMIGIAQKLTDQEKNLNRFLGVIFSEQLNAKKKTEILEREYNIPVRKELKEEIEIMCNLSQGIKEKGIVIGEKAMAELFEQLMKMNRTEDCRRVISDVAYRKRLMQELKIK